MESGESQETAGGGSEWGEGQGFVIKESREAGCRRRAWSQGGLACSLGARRHKMEPDGKNLTPDVEKGRGWELQIQSLGR